MELLALAGAAAAISLLVTSLHVRARRRPVVRPGISEASLQLLRLGRRRIVSRLANTGAFFGVDIGGSLVKLMFFEPDAAVVQRVMSQAPAGRHSEWAEKMGGIKELAGFLLSRTSYGGTGVRDDALAFHLPELGGTFHFVRFETRRLTGALKLVARHGLHVGMATVCATGGGALRYRPLVAALLGGVELVPEDEIDCLVKGMGFLLCHVPAEAYTFHGRRLVDVAGGGGGGGGTGGAAGGEPFRGGASGEPAGGDSSASPSFDSPQPPPVVGPGYPYLLVNVGSGVGFILVTSEHEWVRVSGTSIGGGTYYGLTHMLTGVGSFDEMLDLAEDGNNANVDLTVGDIYGGDYSAFGLKATTIASSFGKAVTWTGAGAGEPARERLRSSSSSNSSCVGGGGGLDASGGLAGGSPATAAAAAPAGASLCSHVGSGGGGGSRGCSRCSSAAARGGSTLERVLEEAGAYSGDVIGGPGPRRSESLRLQHEPALASPVSGAAAGRGAYAATPLLSRGAEGVHASGRALSGDRGVGAVEAVARGVGGASPPASPAGDRGGLGRPDLARPLVVEPPPPSPALRQQQQEQQQQPSTLPAAPAGAAPLLRLSPLSPASPQSPALFATPQSDVGGESSPGWQDAGAVGSSSCDRGAHSSEPSAAAAPASAHAPTPPPAPPALDAASVIGLSAQGAGAWGERKYEARDVARSLLIMISNNIGQLAYLNALKFKCKRVYFAGNFLRRENTIAMRTLSYAITFWSQGSMEGLFLRHEGYCGAIGAFLTTLERD